ncbi:hypothetical protein [Komagataeibacter kakiaceti]
MINDQVPKVENLIVECGYDQMLRLEHLICSQKIYMFLETANASSGRPLPLDYFLSDQVDKLVHLILNPMSEIKTTSLSF